jgi:tetratricopeptide (TPR) repeat protein
MVQLTAERPTSRASYVGPRVKAEQQDIQSLVLSCNKDGMESMRKGELKAAFEQLKYAEAIMIANNTEASNDSLLAVTYNNLGCFFKKTGKMHAALSYLRRALKSEVALETDDVTVAGTHLNICSVLSKLGKHDKANQHALMALELISAKLNDQPDTVTHDDYMVLAMAYHNVAVEREYLKDWDHAAMAYKQGYQVAKRILGDEHPLAETLNANCEKACATASKLIKEKNMACTMANHKYTRYVGIQEGDHALDPTMIEEKEQGDSFGDELDKALQVKPDGEKAGVSLPQIMVGSSDKGIMDMAAYSVDQEEKEWNHFAMQTMAPVSRASSVGSVRVSGRRPLSAGGSRMAPSFEPGEESINSKANALYISPTLAMQPPNAVAAKDKLTDLPPLKMNQLQPIVQELKSRGPGPDLEDSPELLMEIIDLERDSHRRRCPVRSAPNDNRPNRVIKGSTRTSLVLRRTGMFNVTLHRDEVIAKQSDPKSKRTWYSAHVQQQAAKKIQEVWRKWHQYCADNADWMSTTRICATLIQARWRAYHVKRMKLDKAAVCIQRHCRRFLVQYVLKRHTAAVCIQRHVIGLIARRKLRDLTDRVIKIQRLVRGGLTRIRMRRVIEKLTEVAKVIQRHIRVFIARRVTEEARAKHREGMLLIRAAVNLQRYFRGFKGRRRAEARLVDYQQDRFVAAAATKIQSLHRRQMAEKRVMNLRESRINEMNRAATFVRKLWLAFITRKRYLDLKRDFESHIEAIVNIQKFARGFLVRLRLWREAVQAQEELWASIEIQRAWRGRMGRLHWEYVFEGMWVREIAGARLQRNLRGWMARVRVNRKKRQLARKEFESARKRYKSAQKIQALLRGVHVRKFTSAWRSSVIASIVTIQKMWRGHSLRCNMWEQVIHQKATAVQALIRGHLVRVRMARLMKNVLRLQRGYRVFKSRPAAKRRHLQLRTQKRKEGAAVIQRAIRKFIQKRQIQAIAAAATEAQSQS